jgi:signal transduction histidine kinase
VRESLANLVFNAARYSTEGSAILVNLSGTQGNVAMSVANHGSTIPNELLPSLFEPLRRGQSDSLDEAAGRSNLGLGLFIVNEVAVAHGGRVEVASSAGNTVFTVTLVRTPREK